MDQNDTIFIKLFREACEKCFGYPLTQALTETDSKVLSNAIFEKTGLTIGVKSLKNYSAYVVSPSAESKENPSTATLDTLARYILNAPYTSEVERKDKEGHHPYWHSYRKNFISKAPPRRKINRALKLGVLLPVIVAVILIWKPFRKNNEEKNFTDDFSNSSTDALQNKGWQIFNIDSIALRNSAANAGHLTLNTLYGDNWTEGSDSSRIKNLLVRKITDENFSAEIHLTDFLPESNWQQAGMIIGEDESFSGKVIRLSLSYNDFFGGFRKDPEIIIQGLSSSESGNNSKPEEFTHLVLFSFDSLQKDLIRKNLSRSSLKIEKNGKRFRFLYAAGPIETFAFKEIISKEFSIDPKYIGLFAIQGITPNGKVMPVKFDSFKYLH